MSPGQILIVLVAFLLGVVLGGSGRRNSRPQQSQPYRPRKPRHEAEETAPLNQVEKAAAGEYATQPLLNYPEQRIYWHLVHLLKGSYTVTAQTNLGEILQSSNDDAYSVVNSKRVDFCIVSMRNFEPVAVVEYHGAGHFRNNYPERDEVKRISTTKAGLGYLVLTSVEKEQVEQGLRDIGLL